MMVMKSSMSFSKNTLFSQSVSSASISSVCRRIELGHRRRSRREPLPPAFFPASSVYQPEGTFGDAASGGLPLAGSNLFQNSAGDFLQFPEARQVVLKIVVQELRVLRAQLRSQNHVAQLYRMRKQRVFLQFLECDPGVVVIHGFPQRHRCFNGIVRTRAATGEFVQGVDRGIA